MRELDPCVWFGKRDVFPTPRHFIKASTPMTTENYVWVVSKLKGRYSVGVSEDDNFVANLDSYIFFEESGDAMMYELRWSGK